jgi:hypothetical protein
MFAPVKSLCLADNLFESLGASLALALHKYP